MDSTAISLVRTTFKAVAAIDDGPARLTQSFYSVLFANNPDVREFFPAAMEAQRERLVHAIAYVIDQLDDPEPVLLFLAQLGRDHRKYGVVDAHYTAVGNALIFALKNFAGNEMWTDEVDNAWREAIALIASVMMEAANAETGPATWTGTVVEHKQVLQDVAVVRLQLDRPMEYGAGQYVSVTVPGRPRMWRYLSPAIPSNPEGQIEFHVRRVSGGWVSPAMVGQTNLGDTWVMGSPLGALGVDRTQNRDMLMIGSGTGIAPLRAQLMEMAMRANNPNVHVFVGGNYPCDLYDIETLWQLSLTNPWLTVIPVSEEDTNPWFHLDPIPTPPAGMYKRITGKVSAVAADFGDWSNHDIQIVGSASTIQTAKFRLQAKGVPVENMRHDPLY
ncbi:globin family protein [Rhodococcus sp. MTM3W5.2]|uniref:globin domain-containing protein n=1 Tax=Rhodococcus sp. MTM3W5.2 TaxID=1805827 RepID=UPI00097958E5|nr:globin domain-containing protein [Rhodococcus sp. MTM3W5.2]AQA23874.1 globin family protein [Rhodococcus sp. MTM3W5.2]